MRLPRGVVPVVPGPGQESVWDYPRPPAVRATSALVVVELAGRDVCRTTRALQVLETSHPPSWYLPADDWLPGSLRDGDGGSYCEWKGSADYLDVVSGDVVTPAAAWTYRAPLPAFAALRDYVSVYPGRMDRVTVDGEEVRAQDGGFYGGWITASVVGPFKGSPGSWGW
jgi:uncharacterized protein (DUF427 family)